MYKFMKNDANVLLISKSWVFLFFFIFYICDLCFNVYFQVTPPGGNLNPDANTFESKKTSHAVVDANQWEQQQTTATGGEDPSKFSL